MILVESPLSPIRVVFPKIGFDEQNLVFLKHVISLYLHFPDVIFVPLIFHHVFMSE